jgi:PAS domain S-box-containing protein
MGDSVHKFHEQLRLAEEHAREMIDAIPQQIWSGPPDGSLDYCNYQWRAYAGLKLEDLQGDGWQRILHLTDRDRVLNAWRESVVNGTPYEQEERHLAADGTYRWFLCHGLPLRDPKGRIKRWYGTNTEVEDRKRAEEERERLVAERLNSVGLINHHVRNALQVINIEGYIQPENRIFALKDAVTRIEWVLREMLPALATTHDGEGWEQGPESMNRRLIQAQEQERIRIARDLHDDVSQRLALFAIQLTQLHRDASRTEFRSQVRQMQAEIEELATSVQHLSHKLHCSKLEYLGVVTAMRSWCREFGEKQKMEVDFESCDIPSSLPSEVSLCLYRVLQEALHNAAKHSGVRHFDVQLGANAQEIYLTVRDCGAGFETAAAARGQGLGLTSMRERLTLVNGYLSIESQPKRGTIIHARVPFTSGVWAARAG